jgi:hypothetical protein
MGRFIPPHVVKQIKQDVGDKRYQEGFMTGREFLQHFGTGVCRHLYGNCWVDACYRCIWEEGTELAIISDCRFPNELERSKENGAKVVRFKRQLVTTDEHPSETALDDTPDSEFDLVIDNSDLTIVEKNKLIMEAMIKWGWLQGQI